MSKDPLKVKTPLSNRLTVAIRQSVADVKACEKDPRYVINMYAWYEYKSSTGVCEVCAAGASMARRTDVSVSRVLSTCHFSNSEMFQAIDCVRSGHIGLAVERLGFEMSRPKRFADLEYSKVGYDWWAASILERADYLETNRHRIKRRDSLTPEACRRLEKYSI